MRLALLVPVLALTGCATHPSQVSTARLCEYVLFGTSLDREVATEEAQRRGLDCVQLYPAISAKRAQDAANTATAIQLLNASRPAPAPAPVHCSTQVFGNQAQTVCR